MALRALAAKIEGEGSGKVTVDTTARAPESEYQMDIEMDGSEPESPEDRPSAPVVHAEIDMFATCTNNISLQKPRRPQSISMRTSVRFDRNTHSQNIHFKPFIPNPNKWYK